MISQFDQAQEAAAFIRQYLEETPVAGIILGTGLGQLLDEVDKKVVLDYRDIPHFPLSTVESHAGKLILGKWKQKTVLVMQGRFHFYEGYSMKEVTFPVRVMKLLGIKNLLVSNVSGGINPDLKAGQIVIIRDHIYLQPDNPLRGPNDERFGPRFPDMFETYDREFIHIAENRARKEGISYIAGIYASVPGPNLETEAEYQYLHRIGADIVGMSTAPEIIVGRHMNMRCFAVSAVTDLCYPGALKPVNIKEILETAHLAQPAMTLLFSAIIESI